MSTIHYVWVTVTCRDRPQRARHGAMSMVEGGIWRSQTLQITVSGRHPDDRAFVLACAASLFFSIS